VVVVVVLGLDFFRRFAGVSWLGVGDLSPAICDGGSGDAEAEWLAA
jgi:hypothetical protein